MIASDPSTTPRIGLLATLISTQSSYRSAGLHTYSHQLLHALAASYPQVAWHAFVGDRAYQPPAGLRLHYPALGVSQPLQRILWEQSMLPVLSRRLRLDLIHGLAHAIPVASRIPRVVTFHDLSFMHYPQAFRLHNRLYLQRMAAYSARHADAIIAVSQATAHDLQHLFAVAPAKITVVYNGIDPVYVPLPRDAVASYRQQAGWPERYILTVGTLEPRKNHLGLIEAYAHYRQISDDPAPLLIGGGKGWYYETIFQRVAELGLAEHVHFLGFVPLDALPWLYNGASLFVYPSLYEGFGLPVAEAMACGVPTITSNQSSLPEVAGDAALCIDPQQPQALAQAMHEVLSSRERQDDMRNKGLQQSARFRWDKTAAATMQVYQDVLTGPHS